VPQSARACGACKQLQKTETETSAMKESLSNMTLAMTNLMDPITVAVTICIFVFIFITLQANYVEQ